MMPVGGIIHALNNTCYSENIMLKLIKHIKLVEVIKIR